MEGVLVYRSSFLIVGFLGVFFCVIFILLQRKCFLIWLGFELSLYLLLVVLVNESRSVYIRYFVFQTIGSLGFLLSLILVRFSNIFSLAILLFLLLKLGLFPIHWWFVQVVSNTSYGGIILLTTISKMVVFVGLHSFVSVNLMGCYIVRVVLCFSLYGLLNNYISNMGLKGFIGWLSMLERCYLYFLVFSCSFFFYLFIYMVVFIFLGISGLIGGDLGGFFFSLVLLIMSGFPPFFSFFYKLMLGLDLIDYVVVVESLERDIDWG